MENEEVGVVGNSAEGTTENSVGVPSAVEAPVESSVEAPQPVADTPVQTEVPAPEQPAVETPVQVEMRTESAPNPTPEPVAVQSDAQSTNSITEMAQVPEQVEQPATEPMLPEKNKSFIKELFAKGAAKIQLKKRLGIEKIMSLFAKKHQITNDEVEKALHVSDATATRYLEQLEKENKIKQNGKTGKGVTYTKN